MRTNRRPSASAHDSESSASVFLSALVLVAVAAGTIHSALALPIPGVALNVFNNGRVPVLKLEEPSRWIGKLYMPSGSTCTAGLIAKDLVVTAAHCVIDAKTGTLKKGTYTFHYGMIAGRSVESTTATRIWWGTADPARNREDDWAILRLKTPLGAKYGWMGTRTDDLSVGLDRPSVSLTGYGGDYRFGLTASYERACSFTARHRDGMFLHNCNASRGSSGAPMYRATRDARTGRISYVVVALNVAEFRDGKEKSLINIPYTDGHANIAVPASKYLPTLKKILAGQD